MTINKMVVFVLLVLTFSVMCVVPVCGLSESPDSSAARGVNNTSTNETVYGSGPTSPATAETGLVAYYPLDGDIVDHSGNGLNGTIHGASFVAGHRGRALCFDGLDEYVLAPVNINPDVMPQMTMMAWARSNSESKGWVISHDNGGYDRTLNIDARGGGTGWSAFSGSKRVLGYSPVTIGDWAFLAAVYDQEAETVKLYVNGTLINEVDGKLGSGTDDIHIGSNPPYGRYFSGAIDEVRIYNYTLSADEIKAHYEEKAYIPTPMSASGKAAVLFEADFDDGTATGFGNEVGDWEVRLLDPNNGKYTATAGTMRFSMAGDLAWQDYVVEADFYNAQEGGLLVRASDQGAGIALIVRPASNEIGWNVRKDGRWDAKLKAAYTITIPIFHIVRGGGGGGDSKEEVKLEKATLGHEPGEELHVKVVVSGSEFKAYINGERKTTLNSAEFTSGKIGLYLYEQPDQYWDNVVVATQTSQPTEDALVAYYPFEDDLVDHSGHGNDGTNNGGATFVMGHSGKALSFDGLNDYVFAPVDINPDVMPQMTMMAWARSNSDSEGTVISCDLGGYDRTINVDARGGGKGWSAFSGSKRVLGYSPVTIGDWAFVAAVYDQDAETVKLYVNGTLINEGEGKLGLGCDYIHIGSNPSYGSYFSGTIDEVRIYNYALSADKIKAIYEGLLVP